MTLLEEIFFIHYTHLRGCDQVLGQADRSSATGKHVARYYPSTTEGLGLNRPPRKCPFVMFLERRVRLTILAERNTRSVTRSGVDHE